MTQKPSKSVDLTSSNVPQANQETGLPENDDEILSQLNQMTQDLMLEERQANLYMLQPKESVV